jgi:putative serine protease PepD
VRAQLPPPEKNFDQATLAKGTVKLETDDSIGSGTIISEDGLILTNAHVAAPSLLGNGPDPKALLVYVNENGDARAVEPKFIARTVAADGKRDLAVVRIEETIGHNKVTAEQLQALTSIPVGKNAPPGTEIEILGFPGVAKSGSVTFTRGLVSSYAPGPAGENQYANTDAKVEHGNSGGLAADKAGTIVGVPTRIYCPLEKDRTGKTVQNCVSAEGGGTQNELTAIDMAAPLIAAAKGNTSYRVAG